MMITRPNVDIRKLKEEIKRLTELNRHHKLQCKDSRRKLGDFNFYDLQFDRESKEWKHKDPAKGQAYRTWSTSGREWGKLAHRITKLCTLRALLRGKIHFSPNTEYPKDISEEALWKWTFPEAQEFSRPSI